MSLFTEKNNNSLLISDIGDRHLSPISIIYCDGIYHLYTSSKKGLYYKINHYISHDLIYFNKKADIYKSMSRIGTGSALLRGGKINIIFDKGYFKPKQRLLISKNTTDYELYPLAVTPRGHNVAEPRILYSEGAFYMLASHKKGKAVAIFKSFNLMSWQFSFTTLWDKAKSYGYPSNARYGNKNVLFYYDKKNDKTFAILCKIDVNSKGIEPLKPPIEINGLKKPRTFALPNGKVILFGTKGKKDDTLTMLKEIKIELNGISLQDIKGADNEQI